MNGPNFIAWFHLLLEILSNISIAINYFPVCEVKNREINLKSNMFSGQAVFLHNQKVRTKI